MHLTGMRTFETPVCRFISLSLNLRWPRKMLFIVWLSNKTLSFKTFSGSSVYQPLKKIRKKVV